MRPGQKRCYVRVVRDDPQPAFPTLSARLLQKTSDHRHAPIPAVGVKPIRHNIEWLRFGNEQLITAQEIPRFACACIKVMESVPTEPPLPRG